MSEMCGTQLAENTGRKKSPKIAIWAPSHNFVGLYLRNYGTYRQSEKNVKQRYVLTCPHNMVNFGLLTAETCWRVLGHPCKCQRVSRLAFVTAATSLIGGQPNFARCMAVSWPDTLYMYIHFWDILPPVGILPRAKFIFCPSTHHRTSFSGYIFATKASIDNRKKLVKQQYVLHMSPTIW